MLSYFHSAENFEAVVEIVTIHPKPSRAVIKEMYSYRNSLTDEVSRTDSTKLVVSKLRSDVENEQPARMHLLAYLLKVKNDRGATLDELRVINALCDDKAGIIAPERVVEQLCSDVGWDVSQ